MAKIACSTLTVPVLVPVAVTAAGGASALLAAALGAAGNAADWAMAATDAANTVDVRNRANLLVMWLILNSLEFIPGNRLDFSYKPMLAASQHEPDRLLSTEEAGPEFPAPHAEPEAAW